ncbi:MAG: NAD-dependent epimerase/dehydratase family protein [Betaproteobacteria bacterium]|nr:NAD-dependent epimerase/dehydratase family protein [Betaproteobacteria bacterium]
MRILVTGSAGFIGMHTAARLLSAGHEVVGVDCLTDYYDVSLKRARLAHLGAHERLRHHEFDLCDSGAVEALFAGDRFDRVIHLAAQPGVRYSLANPRSYIDRNVTAFLNVLEACRHHGIAHLVYASSSSVYGGNTKLPFHESDPVDHPVSLYAATKRANELMAHTYSHLFGLPTTGLRFFTVYGPWGRPDMSPMLFASAIVEGRTIDLFNHGESRRDFTYVDDVVEGVVRVMDHVPSPSPSAVADSPERSWAPFRLYNIGNHDTIDVRRFVSLLESALGRRASVALKPMEPGDVEATFADVEALSREVGFAPSTPIETGVARFVEWFHGYRRRGHA